MRLCILLLALPLVSVSFSSSGQQKFDIKASVARGQEVYTAQCMSCHMEQGEGIPDIYPPLAKSDFLMANRQRSIDNVLHGVSGEIVVNGKTYNMEMTPFAHLSDEEISDVLNYVRNSWGNREKKPITTEEVKALRK